MTIYSIASSVILFFSRKSHVLMSRETIDLFLMRCLKSSAIPYDAILLLEISKWIRFKVWGNADASILIPSSPSLLWDILSWEIFEEEHHRKLLSTLAEWDISPRFIKFNFLLKEVSAINYSNLVSYDSIGASAKSKHFA